MLIVFYEQAVCKRVIKMMASKMFITLLVLQFNGNRRDNISPVQRSKAKKRVRKVFLDCHVTVHGLPNKHTHSSRETIVYCLSTYESNRSV